MTSNSMPSLNTAFPHTPSLPSVPISSSSAALSLSTPNLPPAIDNNQHQQQFTSHSSRSAIPISGNSNKQPPKGPLCILAPCSNSHPFEERRIIVTRTEDNAVKIGRSVVRLQPSSTNAIFDCKVLSRNHAILWQNTDGQFLIKDTRSSNGTFVNNERLSASGEESEPRELFSGDILQLGVEIVDNTKKVASGCVTCIVRLLNERGEECAGRSANHFYSFPILNEQQIPLNYTLIRNDKIFMLNQYIKEAKFRENTLGQKLQSTEEMLHSAQEALQMKWEEQINQELLLSRIELLESQLSFFATKTSATNEDELKQEIQKLLEDRAKAEQMAKESLRTKCEQMQETSMRLHDAEMGLVNVEEECAFLRQRCADFEDQHNKQRDDYETLLKKYNEICAQLCAAEKAASSTISISHQPHINGNIPQEEQQYHQKDLQEDNAMPECNDIGTKYQSEENAMDIKWIEVPAQGTERNDEDGQEHKGGEKGEEEDECQRMDCAEMKKMIACYKKELAQLRTITLEDNYCSSETNAQQRSDVPTGIPSKSPNQNFQVFLLSAFPFILIIFLFVYPFFGFNWIIPTDENEQHQIGQQEETEGQKEMWIKQGEE